MVKKCFAAATAAVIAFSVCGGIPTQDGFIGGIAIEASAAESDFVIDQRTVNGQKLNYLVEYKGKGGDVVIPDSVDWIASGVFKGNRNIKTVKFPCTKKDPKKSAYIETEVFKNCWDLKSVVFEGKTKLCSEAFSTCINLSSAELKGGVDEAIGSEAFYGCERMKSVKIGESGANFEINSGAFWNCFKLSKINIPSGCTFMAEKVFLNCYDLTNVDIPKNTALSGNYIVGYSAVFYTKEDCVADISGKGEANWTYLKNDGGHYGYNTLHGTSHISDDEWFNSYKLYFAPQRFIPKTVTVGVVKGSSAERWVKANGVKYSYIKESDISAPQSSSKLSAPENIKCAASKTQISITWDAVKGADAYRVFILDTATNKYVKLKDVKTPKCTISELQKGTKYSFKVAALVIKDKKYEMQTVSKSVSVTTKFEVK